MRADRELIRMHARVGEFPADRITRCARSSTRPRPSKLPGDGKVRLPFPSPGSTSLSVAATRRILRGAAAE
jgi:hypothetical protein